MEFAPLTWGGAAPTHLELLNKLQRRAERLIYGETENSNLPSLQHRRDVAGMTVLYKIQVLDVEHLRPLRQPSRPAPRATRAAAADTTRRALHEQSCNTLHHQMQFVSKYTKLWNAFVTATPDEAFRSCMKNAQTFKVAIHKWLCQWEL